MLNIAIWSQVIVPGSRVRVVPECDFRLTTASFGEELVDEKGRTSLKLYRTKAVDSEEESEEDEDDDEEMKLEFETEPVVFGALVPGKIETLTLDLVITEDEPVEFEVTGKNKVYLVGNYIEQNPMGPPDFDSDDDEEDYDLNEVSSDVEINGDELMEADSADEDHGRIQEVEEPPKKEKSKKRARESDAAELEEQPKSKKEKKKEKKEAEKKAAEKVEEPSPAKSETKEKGKVHTTKSGVTVDVRTPGKGPGAKAGQRLKMRYIGKLTNGTIFDKNTKGSPFSFTLGKGEVIKGWDEGIAGLPAGAEAVLTIPPAAAYGSKKVDKIPANSTLKFEIKLLSIN